MTSSLTTQTSNTPPVEEGHPSVALPRIPDGFLVPAGDRKVVVSSRVQRPNAALLQGVMSPEECNLLIQLAHQKGLQPSSVVDRQSGESVPDTARTSSGIWFARGENPLIQRLEKRLSTLTGWPADRAEGIQVLRYDMGQEYKPHFDWFDASKPGYASHLSRGGQRVGTTVIYLANAADGGGTVFPKAGLEMTPLVGGAVFFSNLLPSGQVDELTLHGGAPVLRGTKIVATYWQRESAFG